MPRISAMQTNFTAGELSPRLYGRTDIDRYGNGAAVIENAIIHVQGGVERRAGMRFLAAAKHANKRAVLIPYVFNQAQAYMLEVGDAYVRVFLADGTPVMDGAVPYELQTSYAEADLPAIDYVQGADTMFLMHGNYRTARLRRYGDAAWVLDDVPWITAPFDEIGTMPDTTLTVSDTSVGEDRTLTAGADTWLAADVGRTVTASGGLATITAITSVTEAKVDITVPFPDATMSSGEWTLQGSPLTAMTPSAKEPVGTQITLELSLAGWRDDDVGKWVSINGGLVQIVSVSSAMIASGNIHTALSADVAAPAYAWELMAPVWGDYNGYPSTGTLFQQRLFLAGSPGFPQTVWGSRIGRYYDFTLGTNDDDAFAFTMASDQLNPILNLSQLKVLVGLTAGGEFTITGSDDGPITPTSIQVRSQSNYGCNGVAPERVGNELTFVQRGNRKVRAMSADKIVTDEYGSPDISVLAEHVTTGGVTGMAYAMQPDSVLWCTRADGQLATCTIDRDQQVVGWSRQVTDGAVEAVAMLPDADGDQIWVIVRRTINGETVRYIERIEPGLMTDCASVQTDAAGMATWTGLDHLEGRTVTVKGDGVQLTDQVVQDGSITIERAAKTMECGLPYTTTVTMLRPAINSSVGTSQASNLRVNRVIARVRDTVGLMVNGTPALARQTAPDALDQPPPAVTGDVPLDTLGWDVGKWDLTLQQPQPYPWNLQAVIVEITVNQ